MKLITEILILLVALIHLYFLWLEMFGWTTKAKKTFRSFPPDYFEKTKVLAANQGLYNGFLAAGLIWSLLISDPVWSVYVAVFFLACIIIAGSYGAITASRTVFFAQALPAIAAFCSLLVSHYIN
ncbi:MAG TPA: DUF1304 domain-containing protein [Bacteroidia bacterium]